MRLSLPLCASLAGLCASIAPSAASVVISNAATTNMMCSGGICTPTAPDAVLNVQDLEGMLVSGNATVTTTGGVEARDIRIDAPLLWSAATTLELEAFHSIEVNRKVAVRGAGSVWLVFTGTGGEFACNDKGAITLANASSRFTVNQTSYILVHSVASLASAVAANPSGAFALARNFDAGKDGTYAAAPIPTVFSGSFNGLGNTISNLSINDPTEDAYVGLFAETTGAIANVRLVNENVTGGSGSSGSYSTEFIGGLVGYAEGGSIAHGFTSGVVTGGEYVAVGGLLGVGDATVTTSGSAAIVSSSPSPTPSGVGGLIGIANGAITDSFTTGGVSGTGFVGGLVGFNAGRTLERSWATGAVSSSDSATWVGGLVGQSESGTIERSHASGTVTCAFGCGGLVGWLGGGISDPAKIVQSFATGNVSGTDGAGGLVGYNLIGEIVNSYATGSVSGSSAGGLAGANEEQSDHNSIQDSYAAGAVSGGNGGYIGGLIGDDDYQGTSTLRRTYWDTTTTGITNLSQGAGNVPNDPGITGLSDSQLKAGLPKGFDARVWSENPNINGGLPYLIANPPAN